MIRLKNDKKIGANITIKNPKFVKTLDKNLDLVLKDIENEDFDEYESSSIQPSIRQNYYTT